MIEIEHKYVLVNKKDVISRLLRMGFVLQKPRTYELSEMFDNKDSLMQKTDGRIRVRKSGEEVEFCYKKPILRKGIKKEIEYEILVNSYTELVKIIKKMGFSKTTSYERYRTLYKKQKVKATIDEYPFSLFLEIEGSEKIVAKIAKKLGFEYKKNLTDSCDTLFTKWRKKHGLKPTGHMKFSNYNK